MATEVAAQHPGEEQQYDEQMGEEEEEVSESSVDFVASLLYYILLHVCVCVCVCVFIVCMMYECCNMRIRAIHPSFRDVSQRTPFRSNSRWHFLVSRNAVKREKKNCSHCRSSGRTI